VLSRPAGAVDNKKIESRSDVLVFTSAPLASALEVLGPVQLRLHVRGSSPYFDIFARLCDVDPRGRSRNVCDGLLRHQAVPGSGGAAEGDRGGTTMTVTMSSAAHRFGAGHRLRLQVCGGAHPRFARNTGTPEPAATATHLVPVDIEIRHDTAAPCVLPLPTVAEAPQPSAPGAQLAAGYGSPKA